MHASLRSSKPLISTLALVISTSLIATTYDACAEGRDQIRVVGSSTVFPFTAMAAEQFGNAGKFKTPIVESTGTGGGFKLFCEGASLDKPDINDASRKITDSEKETCAKNGVTDIVEIQVGYDGMVIARKKGLPQLDLSKKQIFMALARWLPDKSGKLSANTYQTWDQIDPKLPKSPIEVYGPPPTSGTRDSFAELVMEKGCEQFSEFTRDYPDEKDRKKICHNIREDGKYIESGEDDNIIVQKLVADENALGIFGYSYYVNNPSKIEPNKIEGVEPNVENVISGKYGISRGLYVYVKRANVAQVPGIAEFLKEYTSDAAIGAGGYNVTKGLIPLKAADLKAAQATAKSLAGK